MGHKEERVQYSHSQYLDLVLSVWGLHVFPVSVWVSSYSASELNFRRNIMGLWVC